MQFFRVWLVGPRIVHFEGSLLEFCAPSAFFRLLDGFQVVCWILPLLRGWRVEACTVSLCLPNLGVIYLCVFSLPADVLAIVRKRESNLSSNNDEVELDFERMSFETLAELEQFARRLRPSQQQVTLSSSKSCFSVGQILVSIEWC